MNQAIAVFRTNAFCEAHFLSYYLQSQIAKNWLSSQSKKTSGQQNLTLETCNLLPVPIPPLPEQRKIADILSKWDDALEQLDAMIAAKEQRKKGLMQQLLMGEKRVRGFSKKWLSAKLGTLFNERVEQSREDLPLLAITASKGVVPREDLTKRDTSSEDKSKYLRIAPGDIGYNTMRMWQGVSALSSLEGLISPAYTVCVPSEKIDGRFAAHFFKLPHTIHLFLRHSQGLVDDTLNLKYPNFATIEVRIPSDIQEQRAIADILDTSDEELRLLRTQRVIIDQQKRGLMQQLLTGKVRVKV
jgi:type I restriction enzyme S subunit